MKWKVDHKFAGTGESIYTKYFRVQTDNRPDDIGKVFARATIYLHDKMPHRSHEIVAISQQPTDDWADL
jgi:hypothetical protein